MAASAAMQGLCRVILYAVTTLPRMSPTQAVMIVTQHRFTWMHNAGTARAPICCGPDMRPKP